MALLCPHLEVAKCSCYSHQKIAMELKIANQRQVTMHFKVATSNYLLHDSRFFKVSKYSTRTTSLEKTTKQCKTHLHVPHTRFPWSSACEQTPQWLLASWKLGWWNNHKLNTTWVVTFLPVFYWKVRVGFRKPFRCGFNSRRLKRDSYLISHCTFFIQKYL